MKAYESENAVDESVGKMRQLKQYMDASCNRPSPRPYPDLTRPRGKSIQLLIKKFSFFFPTDVGCNIINNATRFSYNRCLDRLWMIEWLDV